MEIGQLEHKSIDGNNISTEDFFDKVHQKQNLIKTYKQAIDKGAMFDARVFNIPKEEVTNMIYWRQLDAARNSIQMVGQANFSHKELQNKSCNMIQDMLFTQKNINWNDLPTYQKRGSCCIKKEFDSERTHWVIDKDIPMFKEADREYIEKLINFE
jgi:tRNA(His) 5'-end guanylyltransferase